MGSKQNSQYIAETGGKASYIKHKTRTIGPTGYTFDFSSTQFEELLGVGSFVNIFNTGSKTVYVAFDSSHGAIDTTDDSTYNLAIKSGIPFSTIAISGELSQISFKVASGESTTIEFLIW